VLDGVAKVDELVKKAKELEMTHLALTDHGNLSAVYSFMTECKFEGVKPIIGCEFYVNDKLARDRKRNHIIALAKNFNGWKNLIHLNHFSFKEGFYYKPRITHDELYHNAEDLIVTSACLGSILWDYLLADDLKGFKKFAKLMSEATGGNFYFEVIFNNLPQQKPFNEFLIHMSKEMDIPFVITNDVHFVNEGEACLREITRCVNLRRPIRHVNTDDSTVLHDMFLKTALQIKKTCEEYKYDITEKELDEGLENTLRIAEQIEPFEIKLDQLSIPQFYKNRKKADSELVRITFENFEERITKNKDKYLKQLQHELEVVVKKNYSNCFLVMWDIVEFCKREGIFYGAGRGSAVGSLISYLLDITKLDPIQHGLFFERFLSMGRKDPPDIDMDFDSSRRDEVENYIIEKYGEENTAHVLTFGRFGTKGIIRDLGRVFEWDGYTVNRIAKWVDDDTNVVESVTNYMHEHNGDGEAKKLITQQKDKFEMGERLRGNIRHMSLHASGVVVDNNGLVSIPLNRVKDRITCGFQEGADEREISSVGLVKLDILGLAACSIISTAVRLILERSGTDLTDAINDYNFVIKQQQEIMEMFSAPEKHCEGVFQFSSHGMKKFLSEVNPKTFDDLVAVNSLYRPATLIAGAGQEYIDNRKKKPEEIEYIDDRVKSILEPTFGIIIFQEQILAILKKLGKFSLEEGEEIRYAFKLLHKGVEGRTVTNIKRKAKEVVERCIKYGMPKKKADKLFDVINEYTNYAFNKAHATAYAFLAYQTMWLKKNYPLEFYCALLNAHKGDADKMKRYGEDAVLHGIDILYPKINKSGIGFTIDEDKIRAGYDFLDNIGERVAAEIVSKQPFKRKEDFLAKVAKRIVNKRIVQTLEDYDVLEFE
jgi:DNA polymerase-3 subunit alpha